MSEPIFSLIFVNYRSFDRLAIAIQSWERAFGQMSVEFIVVNNDEKEKSSLDMLSQKKIVQLYHLEENVGFGKACNIGASKARGKFLFFLNPDTEYVAGFVTTLQTFLETRPHSIGGVRLVDELSQNEAWSSGRFPTIWRMLDKRIFGFPRRPFWRRTIFSYPDWVSGAALIIQKDFFKILGGFDEQFFLYFEDVDLCQRAKALGGTVWRTPFFVVKHQGGASHTRLRDQKKAYYLSQCYYFLKHRPMWEACIVRFLHKVISY